MGTSEFLRAHAVCMNWMAAYENALDTMIFRQTIERELTPDILNRNRRILRDFYAYEVLVIIWKESGFVTEAALEGAEMARACPGEPLTSHGLAVALAQRPQDVAKLNSQIRNIGLAAETYKMVNRDCVSATKVILSGTLLLDQFMSSLGATFISLSTSLDSASNIKAASNGH